MKLFVYPYTTGSESAKLLAERLGALRIKLSDSTYEHKPDNLVINWGNSNCPITGDRVLNQPEAVKLSVNKLRFFRTMVKAGLAGYLVPYFTNADDIPDDCFPIFCRTKVEGCDGAGIVIAEKRDQLVPADLYTSFVGGTSEYRVTIFRGQVTDIQTKLPREGQTTHPSIRTYANGWGFQRKAVPDLVRGKIVAAAQAALTASGLDFAGVDVLFHSTSGRCYVLEVNTAMGLEGEALNRFAKAIEEYAESLAPAPVAIAEAAPVEAFDPGLDAFADALNAKDWRKVIQLAAERL